MGNKSEKRKSHRLRNTVIAAAIALGTFVGKDENDSFLTKTISGDSYGINLGIHNIYEKGSKFYGINISLNSIISEGSEFHGLNLSGANALSGSLYGINGSLFQAQKGYLYGANINVGTGDISDATGANSSKSFGLEAAIFSVRKTISGLQLGLFQHARSDGYLMQIGGVNLSDAKLSVQLGVVNSHRHDNEKSSMGLLFNINENTEKTK